MPPSSVPLAIIGGGNMAQAIVRGGIDAAVLDPRGVAVCDPGEEQRDAWRKWGVRAVAEARELARWLHEREAAAGAPRGQLLLAVKPQSLAEVGRQWSGLLDTGERSRRVIVSILAGAPSAKVASAMGAGQGSTEVAVVRVMPNTPASIRKGCTAVALGQGTRLGDEDLAVSLFSAIGRVVRIDESLMDAFTAVAGSGPAYVFSLAEAMTQAAIDVGFDPPMAADIARWTIAGAGALLGASDQPAAVLRAAVTSKGGTTAAATSVLDQAGMAEIWRKAITAARDRGRELSKGS